MKLKQGTLFVLLCGVIVCSAALLWASGPAGCYAIVDKIILEPNETAPKRIQVWGLFSLADGNSGNGYLAPQPGYMYFELNGYEQATLAEWSDLKKVAGTETVIAFAVRSAWNGRGVRKATDKVVSPDVYPLNNGITRVVTGQGLAGKTLEVTTQLLAAHKKKT